MTSKDDRTKGEAISVYVVANLAAHTDIQHDHAAHNTSTSDVGIRTKIGFFRTKVNLDDL